MSEDKTETQNVAFQSLLQRDEEMKKGIWEHTKKLIEEERERFNRDKVRFERENQHWLNQSIDRANTNRAQIIWTNVNIILAITSIIRMACSIIEARKPRP